MTTVLFVAYHFPPIGGAGVQRSAKFARYLPEHGYAPAVLTGPGPSTQDHWTPRDESLIAELPKGLYVGRVSTPRPAPSAGSRARAERWLRIRPPVASWWVEGVAEAAHQAPAADVVYASLSPYESAEAAHRISRERGIPWVADLRDPWALDEMRVEPTGLHRRAERRRMGKALSSAAAIVMNTPEAAARLAQAFPELERQIAGAIPNGYDPADMDVERESRDDDALRIVHTGYLHTELGSEQRRSAGLRRALGGSTAGLDIITRSHVFLLRALERLRHEHPELPIELHLAGVTSAVDEAAVSPGVHFRGYLPHHESIALLRSADLLFLPMHNLPPGTRATIVPGKTYEYLGSGRPILAAVPDGDARDILSRVGHAHLCRPDDVDAMVGIIRDLARRRRERGREPDAASGVAERFDRRALTAQLAAVFGDVLGSEPTQRGTWLLRA